jgi:hypothetical protein
MVGVACSKGSASTRPLPALSVQESSLKFKAEEFSCSMPVTIGRLSKGSKWQAKRQTEVSLLDVG